MRLTWEKSEHAHCDDAETLSSRFGKPGGLASFPLSGKTYQKCHLEVGFPLTLHRSVKQPNLRLAVGLFRRRLEAHLGVAFELMDV